jgi:hypothetical protein
VNVKVALVSVVVTAGPLEMRVIGAVKSPISHSHSSQSRPVMPAGPVARTANRCGPAAKPVYVFGEVHASRTPSSQHWKVEPGVSEVKVKVAVVLSLSSGGKPWIVTTGGPSTVHV